MSAARPGLSLTETAVVLGLLALAAAVAVPAAAKVRAAAARERCADNLRVLGRGVLGFEAAYRRFPSSVQNSGPQRSWAVMVLPWVGAEAVAREYDYTRHWCEPENATAIARQLGPLYCPATPTADRTVSGPAKLKFLAGKDQFYPVRDAACTDYSAVDEVKVDAVVYADDVRRPIVRGYGVLKEDHFFRKEDITDGLSVTVMVVESAGRPDVWRMGRRLGPDERHAEGKDKHVSAAPWASRSNDFGLDGFDPTGKYLNAGPCAVNCTNDNEPYSFHPGGLYALAADGAVHFIRDVADLQLFARLVTRNGGEPVNWADY